MALTNMQVKILSSGTLYSLETSSRESTPDLTARLYTSSVSNMTYHGQRAIAADNQRTHVAGDLERPRVLGSHDTSEVSELIGFWNS